MLRKSVEIVQHRNTRRSSGMKAREDAVTQRKAIVRRDQLVDHVRNQYHNIPNVAELVVCGNKLDRGRRLFCTFHGRTRAAVGICRNLVRGRSLSHARGVSVHGTIGCSWGCSVCDSGSDVFGLRRLGRLQLRVGRFLLRNREIGSHPDYRRRELCSPINIVDHPTCWSWSGCRRGVRDIRFSA